MLLLALGLVFLMVSLGRISWTFSLDWFGRWWPAVLIFAGVVLLVEWALDQRRTDDRVGARTLGGGVVTLLIFIAIFGAIAHVVAHGLAGRDSNFGLDFANLGDAVGNRVDNYDDLSSPIAAGSALVIHDPRGDVTVTGTSADNLVHVNVHTESHGWNDREIERKVQQLRPVFAASGKDLSLTAGYADGGKAYLTVTVPKGTPVTVNADHGDINVSGLQSNVSLSANHGDVSVSDVTGEVQATVNDDDASVRFDSIKGSLILNGHTGDVDVSSLTGPLTMHGDFYGTTHLQHISGSVHFDTSRTHFSAERLDDEFSVENDSLDASGLLGPVVLKTQDKNITLERLQGNVDVTNSNGDVNVTNAAPAATINIQNRHGSVDLGLPAASSFVLDAQTKNGDMENDFGLTAQDEGDNHTLHGSTGGGRAKITITTSDGDVTVRKSSVGPGIVTIPPPPAAPAAPADGLATPKVPKAPKAPAAPAAPKSYSF
jgi:DUF4097 and DUF4098 domain-containing protein YvlB